MASEAVVLRPAYGSGQGLIAGNRLATLCSLWVCAYPVPFGRARAAAGTLWGAGPPGMHGAAFRERDGEFGRGILLALSLMVTVIIVAVRLYT